MLKAEALQNVVQLDVHAEIVRIQFEFVSGAQSAVFVYVHGQRGNAAVGGELPVLIVARSRRVKQDQLFFFGGEIGGCGAHLTDCSSAISEFVGNADISANVR